jgi:hypothetical protein
MKSNPKREAALRLLAATGLKRSSYEPPLLRLLWRLGVDAPPPHFATFGGNVFIAGVYFGSIWGFIMWLFFWRPQATTATAAFVSVVVAGLLFGVTIAMYYAFSRRKYKLPPWHSVQAANAGA